MNLDMQVTLHLCLVLLIIIDNLYFPMIIGYVSEWDQTIDN